MKSTENFKKAIESHLKEFAQNDEVFAKAFSNSKKNIDECITYIFNQVIKLGCNGFNDDEIYGMAIHYYDEENIDIGSPVNCKVVVNHTVELTEEEKEEAKQKAIENLIKEEKEKKLKTKIKKEKIGEEEKQISLFD